MPPLLPSVCLSDSLLLLSKGSLCCCCIFASRILAPPRPPSLFGNESIFLLTLSDPS